MAEPWIQLGILTWIWARAKGRDPLRPGSQPSPWLVILSSSWRKPRPWVHAFGMTSASNTTPRAPSTSWELRTPTRPQQVGSLILTTEGWPSGSSLRGPRRHLYRLKCSRRRMKSYRSWSSHRWAVLLRITLRRKSKWSPSTLSRPIYSIWPRVL